MTLAMTRAIERTNGHLYTFLEGDKRLGPFPGATAITGLQDSLGGNDGLMTWAVNLALDEIERRGVSLIEDWTAVRAAALAAKNGPRDIGTAVHAVADQINKGVQPQMFTDGVAPYVAQYGAALYQKGIRILNSERYAVNTEIGAGATYDSIAEIDGEIGPLDVKSGKEKPSQRLQLTVIEMCKWHAEAGMEAEPMPQMDGVGWILLLRPDGYELVRHEITDADREHVAHLVETYHRIKAWAATYVKPSKGEPYAPTFIEEGAAA